MTSSASVTTSNVRAWGAAALVAAGAPLALLAWAGVSLCPSYDRMCWAPWRDASAPYLHDRYFVLVHPIRLAFAWAGAVVVARIVIGLIARWRGSRDKSSRATRS